MLVDFLRAQSRNRTEQADIRLKDRVPNTQLIGKMRTEARFFAEAADLCESAKGAAPTVTSEQSDRLAAETPKVEPKKLGRPPKMTPKQIMAASQGRAQRSVPENDTPETLLANANAKREVVPTPPEYAG